MADQIYPKPPRPKRDRSDLRWHVHYEDMVGEGSRLSPWTGYHRTRFGARIAAWWNQNISTYGGVVTIEDSWRFPRRWAQHDDLPSEAERRAMIRKIAEQLDVPVQILGLEPVEQRKNGGEEVRRFIRRFFGIEEGS